MKMNEAVIISDSDPRKKFVGGVGVFAYHFTKFLLSKNFKVIFIGKKQDGDIIFEHQDLEVIVINKETGQSNYTFPQVTTLVTL